MKKKFKLLPLMVAVMMSVCACGSKTENVEETAASENAAAVIPVEVMEAVPDGISKSLTYVGKVSANNTVDVTSKLSGQVKEVYADVGDTVKKGQVLLLIDDKDIRDQITTTEAQLKVTEQAVASAQSSLAQVSGGGQTATQRVTLETAVKNARINVENSKIGMDNAQNSFNDTEKKYNDYRTMLAAGVITQKDFDAVELGYMQAKNALEQTQNAYNSAVTTLQQAETSLSLFNEKTIEDSETTARNGVATAKASRDSALASLEVLKSKLDYIRVTSPIDGVITTRNIEPTNMVNSGAAPFVVADTSRVTIDVEVSERIINTINVGHSINVNVNAVSDTPIAGVIKTINPAAGNSGSFTVKIEVDNKDGKLKPGMIANVSFIEKSAENVVVVPRNTVIEDNEAKFVYVTDGRKATKKHVVLGVDDGAKVEISGVDFGEKIIISGQNYVTDGGPVTIADDEAGQTQETTQTAGKEE